MQNCIESPTIAITGNNWFPSNPGGLDRYVYELVHNLNRLDTTLELFGLDLPPHASTSALTLTNLATADDSLVKRLWSANQAFRQRRYVKPDAINIHFALYGLPLLPSLPDGVPVTCSFHGPWAQESEREGGGRLGVWFKKQIEQAVYQRCDRFIVLSKAFGNILHHDYGINWDKIHIIPGGVDTECFRPNLTRQQAREQLNWPHDRFILFTPRRLVSRMGLDKLLTALAQVRQANSEIWLAIAGKGPLREALEQQTTELGLSQHVKFLGFLPDIDLPTAYQAADLTVIPSQSLEGFGLVLLESLACGTPALCTPVGGMPEVIRPFSPELITSTIDVDSISLSLKAVIAGQLQLPNRDACRKYACTHFDWSKIGYQVRNVLLS